MIALLFVVVSRSIIFNFAETWGSLQKFRGIDMIYRLFTPYGLSRKIEALIFQSLRVVAISGGFMTTACITAHTPQSLGQAKSAGVTAPVSGLTTIMYLGVLAGGEIEQLGAKYGLRPHEVAERVEAARLCYERQVDMPGFPVHLL